MTIELIANAVVALLLIVMIGYSVVLNRRLKGLRQGGDEMNRLITALNQASERAQASIHQLKSMGQETEHTLKMEVAKARSLADELALITEAGSDLADRIEQRFDERKTQVVANEPDDSESDWLFKDDEETLEPTGSAGGTGANEPASTGNDLLNKLRSAR